MSGFDIFQQLPALGHCEFHVSQFQARVEVQPVGLEGPVEALVLEEKVELFVSSILLWELDEVCDIFEQLVLQAPLLIGEQVDFSIYWAMVHPLMSVSRVEN